MLEILRDPLWQFIAVILTSLTILISYFLYRKQRQRKALSYEILSLTPLLSMNEEVKGKLEIRFSGEPVQQVHLVQIKITNSGNVPIVATDYERQVNLSFGEKAKILTVEVVETTPKSLQVAVQKTIEGSKEKALLPPILMNQGDSFTFKMLVSSFAKPITIDGRIVGVKEIAKASKSSRRRLISIIISGLLSFFAGMGFGLFPPSHPIFWIALLDAILAFAIMGKALKFL